MRVIPKNAHPETDNDSKTEVQLWLPLEFDLANGGQDYCEIQSNDHIVQPNYHPDLVASSCKITSDRKIFVETS
jgi:hypothetical protein